MRRLLQGIAVVVLVSASAAVVAPEAANATGCGSTERFTGTITHMKHWLTYCKGVPFDVVTTDSWLAAMSVTHYDANGTKVATEQMSPRDAGGPSCRWLAYDTDGITTARHAVVKACYSRGVPHLICSKWFAGSYYPYHCGPLKAYNIMHAQGLWSWLKAGAFHRGGKACLKGTVAGGVTATILKVAGRSTGPIGLFASVVGGCVGGLVNYWWK